MKNTITMLIQCIQMSKKTLTCVQPKRDMLFTDWIQDKQGGDNVLYIMF